MKKKNSASGKITLSEYVWIFVASSFVSSVVEVIVFFLRKGYFEGRQGLIYGPFIPIYGLGAIILFYIFCHLKSDNTLIIFAVCSVFGALFEYTCSYVQEKVFGTISWDYSHIPFNWDGRTSLYNAILLGLLGIAFIKYFYPWFDRMIKKVPPKIYKYLTILVTVFMLFDLSVSAAAVYRQTLRRDGVKASNIVDKFLDKHYPDTYLQKIYNNARVVQRSK